MSIASHLKTGLTTLCRCWAVSRRDGKIFGFTDHDNDLEFEGVTFKADTGLTASALQQVTGLAVDNSEAIGALSHASVTEEDIAAGRFDSAQVQYWLVNWLDVTEREVQFSGSLGEIKREDGAFYAELRGASETLNQPVGRVFQRPCQALLGDRSCQVDLGAPGYRAETIIEIVEQGRIFRFGSLSDFAERWFEKGRLSIASGTASGLSGLIKNDLQENGARVIELWQEIRSELLPGDSIILEAGCDKRMSTCRDKFANHLNFRGFPHIPGEDWLMAYPNEGGANDGGSRHQ